MGKKYMNKRGDVTITILVIGIIAVCFLALISFYLASLKTDENFNTLGKITKVNSDMENYLYGKTISVKPSDGKGEHLYQSVEHSTGFLGLGGKKILFEVRYYLP